MENNTTIKILMTCTFLISGNALAQQVKPPVYEPNHKNAVNAAVTSMKPYGRELMLKGASEQMKAAQKAGTNQNILPNFEQHKQIEILTTERQIKILTAKRECMNRAKDHKEISLCSVKATQTYNDIIHNEMKTGGIAMKQPLPTPNQTSGASTGLTTVQTPAGKQVLAPTSKAPTTAVAAPTVAPASDSSSINSAIYGIRNQSNDK